MKNFKPQKTRKYDGKDLYIFVGNKAKIPGFSGPYSTITLKEFNELRSK